MQSLFSFLEPPEPVKHVLERPQLLPIQEDFLRRARVPYTQGAKRVVWQAPCGSGKTVVAAAQTCNALAMGKTVLHIVHRRRLVDQMLGTLERFGVPASPIMEGRVAWNAPVKCASRDTLVAMLEDGCRLPVADLLIFDEAHVKADKVQQWYLHNTPNAYWAGYTATPVSSMGESLSPPYQALVCMAPTSEMIRLGRLVPVKVYNPDAIGRRRRAGDKVKPVGDPVQHWLKYAKGLPTVVFAARVTESLDIVQRYRAAGITAEHIDANTPDDEREQVFERSRTGETKVISNVAVLVEGVDLPWLTCCQMLRGCTSLVLWIQGTGRVMRSFPGKKHGVILDHSGAAHEFGLPDADITWTLEDAGAVHRRNKPTGDKKPITCIACGMVFQGKPACPGCGKVLPRKRRSSLLSNEADDGLLTRYTGEQRTAMHQEALNRLWTKFMRIGRAKGWQMRQAAGAFTREAKIPPWEAGLHHPLPSRNEWDTPVGDWMMENAS